MDSVSGSGVRYQFANAFVNLFNPFVHAKPILSWDDERKAYLCFCVFKEVPNEIIIAFGYSVRISLAENVLDPYMDIDALR